jgi:integrase
MGLQGRIQGLLAENNRLTLAMMEMQKAFGLKTETEKAITLRQALEHFKASFKATTAKTTDSVIFNAEEVLKAIGLDEKHVNVTLQTIQNVLAGLGIESVETRRKRAKGVKRFFDFIAMPANEGGINLGNPAANFKIKTVAALETNEEEQGEMLDPAAILKECTLGLDQRVLIALMGYAGLRLSEATGLAWNDVEWDRPQAKRLIYIRKNAGRQTLKTTGSRRPVKPLPALWPILEKYRAAATKEAKALPMMFYKDAATLETWIVFAGGQTSSPEMSAALTKIVKGKFAFESKLNLCLRHYWTTTMNSKVSKEMESIMGGHSKAIANKHYLNKVETIRGLDLGAAK